MDTFFEQIIPIKKTGTSLMAVIGIWLLALVLSVFLFLIPFLGTFTAIIIFGLLFDAYMLTSLFNTEY